MKRDRLGKAASLCFLGWLLAAGPVARAADTLPVDVELVLAVDVSRSVDGDEAAEQRQGYASALSDPDVISAITTNRFGRIAIAYVEWAAADQQDMLVGWTLVDGEASAKALAARILQAGARQGEGTSISGAIDYAASLFPDNGFTGDRLVIDVSGDGPSDEGGPVAQARDTAVAQGIIINGLPILNDKHPDRVGASPIGQQLDRYYQDQVIGGSGAFISPAKDYGEFGRALLAKLIREIASGATTIAKS